MRKRILEQYQLDCIINLLKQAGFKPFIFHKAKTGSIYIKFNNSFGSLRIGDHSQRSNYAYMWNLRLDYDKKEIKYKPHACYYYPISCIEDMIKDMVLLNTAGNNLARKLMEKTDGRPESI